MYPQTPEDFFAIAKQIRDGKDHVDPFRFSIVVVAYDEMGSVESSFDLLVTDPHENLSAAAILMKILAIEPKVGIQKSATLSVAAIAEAMKYFGVFEGDNKNHLTINALKAAQPLASVIGIRVVATFIFLPYERQV